MIALERKICEPLEVEEVDQALADEASELLHYQNAKQSLAHAGQSLRKAMKELDIRPFTIESIKKYKSKQLWKANIRVYKAAAVGFGAAILGAAIMSATIAYGVAAWGVPGVVLAIIGTIGGLACILSNDPPKGLERRSWQREWLSGTSVAVPEFALQTAIDIKKRVPGVLFAVEHLAEVRNPIQADPFLVAIFNGEAFYLEVWNEPGYKQQREV